MYLVDQMLEEIVTKLFLYFKLRRVKNMFLIGVLRHLKKNLSKSITEVEILSYIEKVVDVIKDWLKIVDHDSGKSLRKTKEYPLKKLKDIIKQYLKDNRK